MTEEEEESEEEEECRGARLEWNCIFGIFGFF
jgi:hypothetical protein